MSEADQIPLLNIDDLHCVYTNKEGQPLQAVAGLSLQVFAGETLGLVGESGCGKSTTGRCIVQLEPISAGKIEFAGKNLAALDAKALRDTRQQLQMVFQDPIASLNPRRKCGDIVADPLRIAKKFPETEIKTRVRAALDTVGFDPDQVWDRLPHQFSGGQCQRISLARAIVSEPKFLICDEPVSALDVSVQAQILNLLEEMKARYALTLIFISHDLAVIKQISDRVAVMYLGRLCEVASTDALYQNPKHPYTKALLDSVPRVDKPMDYSEDLGLSGEMPSPTNPPSGCRFRTRCPRAEAKCGEVVPELREVADGHRVACHFAV